MPPHCDSLDGPVVAAARRALEAGRADLVLPFVPEDAWDQVRQAFGLTGRARAAGGPAAEVADLWFFETVVRLHRAGEGAPYTGLKPAGLDVGPVIPVAEAAIASGEPDGLVHLLTARLEAEIRSRFAHMRHLAAEAGRGLPEARRHTEAMLGLQVWAHGLYQAIGAPAHAGHHEHD
mgnify:CR=1 FL=1